MNRIIELCQLAEAHRASLNHWQPVDCAKFRRWKAEAKRLLRQITDLDQWECAHRKVSSYFYGE